MTKKYFHYRNKRYLELRHWIYARWNFINRNGFKEKGIRIFGWEIVNYPYWKEDNLFNIGCSKEATSELNNGNKYNVSLSVVSPSEAENE